MEAKHWLIYSREHNYFWRPDSSGYTPNISEAGRYTCAEATDICKNGRDAQPDGTPSEVAVVAPEALEQAASQAREQALKEMEYLIQSAMDGQIGYDVNNCCKSVLHGVNEALTAYLAPPQAEARKRIVAQWLEEQSQNTDQLYAVAARGLLAALKEQ